MVDFKPRPFLSASGLKFEKSEKSMLTYLRVGFVDWDHSHGCRFKVRLD